MTICEEELYSFFSFCFLFEKMMMNGYVKPKDNQNMRFIVIFINEYMRIRNGIDIRRQESFFYPNDTFFSHSSLFSLMFADLFSQRRRKNMTIKMKKKVRVRTRREEAERERESGKRKILSIRIINHSMSLIHPCRFILQVFDFLLSFSIFFSFFFG